MKNVLKKNYSYSVLQLLLSRNSVTFPSPRSTSSSSRTKPKSIIVPASEEDEEGIDKYIEESNLTRRLVPPPKSVPKVEGAGTDVTNSIQGLAWSTTVPSEGESRRGSSRIGKKECSSKYSSSLHFPSPFSSSFPSPTTIGTSSLDSPTMTAYKRGEERNSIVATEGKKEEGEAAEFVTGSTAAAGGAESENDKGERINIKRRGRENNLLPLRTTLDPNQKVQQKVKSIGIYHYLLEDNPAMACEIGYKPDEWCKAYPIAINGTRQSPIDICSSGCKCVTSSENPNSVLDIKYPESINGLVIKNTGHGWIVNIPEEVSRNTCK